MYTCIILRSNSLLWRVQKGHRNQSLIAHCPDYTDTFTQQGRHDRNYFTRFFHGLKYTWKTFRNSIIHISVGHKHINTHLYSTIITCHRLDCSRKFSNYNREIFNQWLNLTIISGSDYQRLQTCQASFMSSAESLHIVQHL